MIGEKPCVAELKLIAGHVSYQMGRWDLEKENSPIFLDRTNLKIPTISASENLAVAAPFSLVPNAQQRLLV